MKAPFAVATLVSLLGACGPARTDLGEVTIGNVSLNVVAEDPVHGNTLSRYTLISSVEMASLDAISCWWGQVLGVGREVAASCDPGTRACECAVLTPGAIAKGDRLSIAVTLNGHTSIGSIVAVGDNVELPVATSETESIVH